MKSLIKNYKHRRTNEYKPEKTRDSRILKLSLLEYKTVFCVLKEINNGSKIKIDKRLLHLK